MNRPLWVSEHSLGRTRCPLRANRGDNNGNQLGSDSSSSLRIVGQKKARKIWFLCRQYDPTEASGMGLVNKVVTLAELERETLEWARQNHAALAACHSLFEGSPKCRL